MAVLCALTVGKGGILILGIPETGGKGMGGSKPLLLRERKAAAVNAAAFFCRRAVLLYKVRNGKFV